MKLEELIENIYHVSFPTRKEVTSTFLRFQEHYESPQFRGKIFSLDEFKEWYTANSPKGKAKKRFTYYEDWGGFNIPSHILDPFYEGLFDPLSEKESKLLDAFKDKKGKKFYVIGTFGKDKQSYLQHEVAHGLFYVNQEYQLEVLNELNKVSPDIKNNINSILLKKGYHTDVLVDETHAYLTANPVWLRKKGLKENIKPTSESLNNIFNKYCTAKKVTAKGFIEKLKDWLEQAWYF